MCQSIKNVFGFYRQRVDNALSGFSPENATLLTMLIDGLGCIFLSCLVCVIAYFYGLVWFAIFNGNVDCLQKLLWVCIFYIFIIGLGALGGTAIVLVAGFKIYSHCIVCYTNEEQRQIKIRDDMQDSLI